MKIHGNLVSCFYNHCLFTIPCIISFIQNHTQVKAVFARFNPTKLKKPVDTRFDFLWIVMEAFMDDELQIRSVFADAPLHAYFEKHRVKDPQHKDHKAWQDQGIAMHKVIELARKDRYALFQYCFVFLQYCFIPYHCWSWGL